MRLLRTGSAMSDMEAYARDGKVRKTAKCYRNRCTQKTRARVRVEKHYRAVLIVLPVVAHGFDIMRTTRADTSLKPISCRAPTSKLEPTRPKPPTTRF